MPKERRSYEVRAVWNVWDNQTCSSESHCLANEEECAKQVGRPADHYGLYRNMPDGTQKHVLDFDDRLATLQVW